MEHQATTRGGEARELPVGRLASFEDDEGPDLGSLLSRVPARRPADGDAAEAQPPAPPAPPPTPADNAGTATVRDQAPPSTGHPDQPPPEKKVGHATKTGKRGGKPATTPRHSEGKNRIRSSSVHIPAALVDKIVAERNRSGRSNGQIVIAAIEAAHSRLADLIAPPEGSGGTLFQQRSSRVARTVDGPLTPLNVRLFEDDYTIIDRLVAQFGAFSRGHLITAALTDYLSGDTTPPE
jgi:hypothetical protein